MKLSTCQRKPTKVILFVPQNLGKTQELEAPYTSQEGPQTGAPGWLSWFSV